MADEYNDFPRQTVSKNAKESVDLPPVLRRLKAASLVEKTRDSTVKNDGRRVVSRTTR